MIAYTTCNSGAGYAAQALKVTFTLPSVSVFRIMKMGVFGVELTAECLGTTSVTFDSSDAG